MSPDQSAAVPFNLRELRRQADLLTSGTLDRVRQIQLGMWLAMMLLPPGKPED